MTVKHDVATHKESEVENQHRKITGYRELSQNEIDAMNHVKDLAEVIGNTVDGMKTDPEFDQRWVAIARTHLQEGFMALTRAIAKPTTF